MSSRRDLIRAVPAAGAALVLAEAAVPDRAAAQVAVPDLNGWLRNLLSMQPLNGRALQRTLKATET